MMRAKTKRIARELDELGIDTSKSYGRTQVEKLIKFAKMSAKHADNDASKLPTAPKMIASCDAVIASDNLDLVSREDHDDEEADVKPVMRSSVKTGKTAAAKNNKKPGTKKKQVRRKVKHRRPANETKTSDV